MSEGITVYDPVIASDIALRLRVHQSAVSNWINRYGDFPRPVLMLGPNRTTWIWEWSHIVAFTTENNLPGGPMRRNPDRWDNNGEVGA